MDLIEYYKSGLISESELWQAYFDGEISLRDIENTFSEKLIKESNRKTMELINDSTLPEDIKKLVIDKLEL